jgi:hypothetical protein
MGAPEIEQFLTDLAANGHVAASTQNQAFHALLFLYQQVLGIELPLLDALRAKRPKRLPTGGRRRKCAASWTRGGGRRAGGPGGDAPVGRDMTTPRLAAQIDQQTSEEQRLTPQPLALEPASDAPEPKPRKTRKTRKKGATAFRP